MPPRMNPEEIAMQSLSYPSRNLRTQSRLTQLYTDTKHSSQAAVPRDTDAASPEKRTLDRKYCIQKDRFLAWGFDWTDNLKNSGNIDESVERAGLTEIVESVLENIKSVIEDVESMNVPPTIQPHSSYPSEKHSPAPSHTKRWMQADLLRYEDLIKDMTSAIDLLCDLSKSRRAAHQDETKTEEASEKFGGKKRPSSYQHPFDRPSTPVPAYPSEPPRMNQSFAAFGQETPLHTTLVSGNPNSIPRISPSILVLPQEGPPGYGDSKTVLRGASSSPRLFGHLRRTTPAESFNTGPESSLVPVMIEYAHFDRLYRETDMELPLSRLEHLHSILCTWDSGFSSALAKPIAYFEDPEHARYGLIFERPYLPHSHQLPATAPESAYSGQPTTLSTLLHQASKAPTQSSSASVPLSPPLEDRFRLAQQLLLGFRFLQQHGFAHRNISSSNIAVLPSNGTGRGTSFDVRRPLICSIDLFSDYDVEPSPEILQQNIYRHPDDPRIKGPTAAPEYDIRFDLYSLSLLLLEIGLWHPLADIYKEKYSLKDFKTRVEKVWIRRLAGRCGSAYTRCVQELFDAGSKFQSKQGARDLMQVLNTVSARLERCCLIDLEEEESDGEGKEEATPFTTGHEQGVEDYSSHRNDKVVSEAAPANVEEDAPDTEQTKKAPARLLFQDLEIPSQVLAQYQAFEGQVVRITEKILNRSKESCWIDLLYSGEDKASARPTICIGCSSTKMVRSALKKHLRYDRDLFDLAVFKDTVRRSKSAELHRSKGGEHGSIARNPGHFQRPLCGSSIGAWRFGEHSAAVSFGGVVMVDNEPYGMTVHHLLEDPEPEEDSWAGMTLRRPSNDAESHLPMNAEIIEDEDESDDEEESTTDDTPSLFEDSDDEDEDEFTNGIQKGQDDEIVLTQPALDDVEEGFFPSAEDEDDEHLLSHRLGYVHASSGLRHSQSDDGVKHEIDWLLMKLDPGRIQPYNVIAGGKRFCPDDSLFSYRPRLLEPICRPATTPNPLEDLYPCHIAPSTVLPGLNVHSVGRTSGLGHGTLSQTMRWVRFHGRRSFSQVWSVLAADFGQGGDSGAWVVDNVEGRVCGHVLAWSSKFGVAYIAPMDIMFEDMRRTLGAQRIALPGAEEQPRPLSAGPYEFDFSSLSIEEVREQRMLLARHMLHSGNPGHLEREWSARRSKLGQLASG